MVAAVSYNDTEMVAGGTFIFDPKQSKTLNYSCANKVLWLGLGTKT